MPLACNQLLLYDTQTSLRFTGLPELFTTWPERSPWLWALGAAMFGFCCYGVHHKEGVTIEVGSDLQEQEDPWLGLL